MLKQFLCRAALLGFALVPQLAAAGEIPAAIKAEGVLKLSINATYPPMEYKDPETNAFMGLDIELVDALAAKLGLKVERTDGVFAQLIPALSTGRTAFILSGITDTPQRRETMDFVNYMRAGAMFYTLTSSSLKDPSELCGKKVATIRSTTYPGQIKDWSDQNCVAAGKAAIEVVGTESSPDARLQLKQGRADAAVQGGETIPFTSKQEGGIYRVIGKPLTTVYYGAAFRKTDVAFRDAIADALQELINDGTYAKIFAKWELTDSTLPAIMINSEPRK
ncbi:ABC transporter substrate-binding protein [Bosea caraganae]|nr:ABC transporter substrate-binding protein [Bosea caraganae]